MLLYLLFTKSVQTLNFIFFFQAEDGIRDKLVTGVQTCALPIFERWFEVAGATLRVSFAGDRLVEYLAPALGHLEIPASSHADAVFHVWDSESTGVAMVPPICAREHFTGRGDIWSMASRRFKSAFLAAEVAVALMDVETATGVFWIRTACD